MTEPRKHHYLPQFYLRGFSSDRRNVWQLEKKTGRSYQVSISDAAAIRDYHELDDESAEDPYALEKRLSEIEGVLADALATALRDGLSSGEVHLRLLEFLSLMRFRVPAFKEYIEESLRQVVRSTGLILERKRKLPPPPKGLEEALRMDRLSISISNWKCLEHMFALAADEDILRILAAMSPSIVWAPFGNAFVTSDQPVAHYNAAASPKDAYGASLGDPNTELSLALSSRALLCLSWKKTAPSIEATSDQVAEFNRRTVVMAVDYVFAETNSEALLRAISQNARFFAGIDLQVLDAGSEFLQIARIRPVVAPEKYNDAPPEDALNPGRMGGSAIPRG